MFLDAEGTMIIHRLKRRPQLRSMSLVAGVPLSISSEDFEINMCIISLLYIMPKVTRCPELWFRCVSKFQFGLVYSINEFEACLT
jgi:hypothetical protein